MDALTPEQFREKLAAACIGPDEPLHAILLSNFETAQLAREAVQRGARGLTPEGERELIFRITETSVAATSQAAGRLATNAGWRSSLLFTLAGISLLIVGYIGGEWNRPGFFAEVEALNSTAAIANFCAEHTFSRAGRMACNLPSVWIRKAP